MSIDNPLIVTEPTVGEIPVDLAEFGGGHPILLLHGGGGSPTVVGFARLLAERERAHVYVPTHPGFGGTSRPDGLATVADLARLYVGLLDILELGDVTVVGNSIGGWIAAEMALLESPRVSSLVLIDAVGVRVPDHPVVDFFSLTFPELAARSYFEPERFLVDSANMTEPQRSGLASNRTALGVYAASGMEDPTLLDRLSGVTVPTRVIWGAADRIAEPEYGQALAEAIPGADFILLPRTGHLPQIETPDALVAPVWEFADRNATNKPVGAR